MAKQFPSMEPAHTAFIQRQKIFFTASAAPEGRVNLSPKGYDVLRILDANTIAYLDHTGSGNETAAHLRLNDRLTVMFCAFEGVPLILRLYGRGTILRRGSPVYDNLLTTSFAGVEPTGVRQAVTLDIDLVQTSCGYGVPFFDYRDERPSMARWAEAKGEEGLDAYRREKNVRSIDGFPTGLFDHEGSTLAEADASPL